MQEKLTQTTVQIKINTTPHQRNLTMKDYCYIILEFTIGKLSLMIHFQMSNITQH